MSALTPEWTPVALDALGLCLPHQREASLRAIAGAQDRGTSAVIVLLGVGYDDCFQHAIDHSILLTFPESANCPACAERHDKVSR